MKISYFAQNNYWLLYLHRLFVHIASSSMYLFTGAYFIKSGMPLHFVLLFFGLEFGVRGALCPFGLMVSSRLGIIKSLIIAFSSLTMFFVIISFAKDNLIIAYCSLFFAAIAGAIYYPLSDVLEAIYIKENHNRAKQFSLSLVSKSIGKIIGALSIGCILTHYSFAYVIGVIIIVLICAILPFLKLQTDVSLTEMVSPKEVFKTFASENIRQFYKPFFGEQLLIIFKEVMIPIFIFTIVGEMDKLGGLFAIAIITENIITLLSGRYIDKFGHYHSLKYASIAYGFVIGGYAFLVSNPLSAFIAESMQKTAFNIHDNAFIPHMHLRIREEKINNILLFGTCWQMVLCFGELLVLPIYGLIAYFIGMNIFYVSCVMGCVGLYMTWSYMRNWKIKMKMIKQRQHNDCGVCCIAMLCNITYEQALDLAFDHRPETDFSTPFEGLSKTFEKAGFKTKIYQKIPDDPKHNGLIEISYKRNGKLVSHYVVYDANTKQILDPQKETVEQFASLRFIEVYN